MTYKMLIPPDKVADVRTWFKTRGGCLVWHNQEIGNMRPDMMTPATHEDGKPGTPPHWSMGNPEPIKPEEIGVRTETPVPTPPEWFPVCKFCEGSGRYSIAKIAAAREISLEETRAWCAQNYKPEEIADDSVRCTGCSGKGHDVKELKIPMAVRRRYYGPELTDHGRNCARKRAKKLKEHYKFEEEVHYDWQHVGYGMTEFTFFLEKIEPFTLESTCSNLTSSS